ncbi:membrane-bound transcription factor site-2 protease homolog isoform X2 [Prosopis cineraria]|uniref:membrane-bound transcription factor site-2 protease homolog isoform X2 n=1 Tax=Prosopis cineraria TaxID=364024 RepID=UPI00240FAED5|nr:membrane-bound transcription factor site-2 protease homolog isoform X2 [Prosopis cineraria]
MEIEGRRLRRFGIRRESRQNRTLLPIHASASANLSRTISCWLLKIWFSVGVGFALSALLGVTLILLWELARLLRFCNGIGNNKLGSLMRALFFGFPSLLSGLSLSLADVGYICISTIMSVLVHEFGHAVSATSEGIQIEYIAIFTAILFPGALVAFDNESLEALPSLAALRVYSAGIWHNAVCCVACGLALFLLPLVLLPFYTHGQGPMVLHVPPASPLSGYLAPGDVIQSVDNVPIHNAQDWVQVNSLSYNMKLNNANISQHNGDLGAVNGRKGYCVPSHVMEESKFIKFAENQYACPNELTAFVKVFCPGATSNDGQSEDLLNRGWVFYCLNAIDVVKLKKCGEEWGSVTASRSGCMCSKDEFCLAPVQEPGSVWVEITYLSPSHECLSLRRKKFPVSETSNLKETDCGGTFIFVGDVILMAHSIQLTSYQPRWTLNFIAYFPNLLERLLLWTFHASLALALLNSLPVYFLDGASILDVALSHFTSLCQRKKEKVLRLCLFGGTVISIVSFFHAFI